MDKVTRSECRRMAGHCRSLYAEGLQYPAWTGERADLWSRSLIRFIEFFVQPRLGLPEFQRQWAYLLCRHRLLCLLAPRAHGKTYFTCYYALWRICMNPNSTILLAGATVEMPTQSLRVIKSFLESNERLRAGFGPLFAKGQDPWTQSEIIVKRPDRTLKDPTVATVGVAGSVLGRHVSSGCFIADDIVQDNEVQTEAGRARIRDWFGGKLLPVLEPSEQGIVIGTRKSYDDLYAELLENPAFFAITSDAVQEERPDGSWMTLWPDKWPETELKAMREAIGPLQFDRNYRNTVLAGEYSEFPMSWFTGEGGKAGCYDWNGHMLNEDASDEFTKVQAVDLAISQSSDASYFVILTLGLDKKSNVHILNLVRERLHFPDQVKRIVDLYSRFLPTAVVVETNSYQQALQQQLAADAPYIPVVAHTTGREKDDPEKGLMLLQPYIEAGRIRFPMGDPISRSASEIIVGELNRYPRSKFDDTVIALWLGVSRLLKCYPPHELRALVLRSELAPRVISPVRVTSFPFG